MPGGPSDHFARSPVSTTGREWSYGRMGTPMIACKDSTSLCCLTGIRSNGSFHLPDAEEQVKNAVHLSSGPSERSGGFVLLPARPMDGPAPWLLSAHASRDVTAAIHRRGLEWDWSLVTLHSKWSTVVLTMPCPSPSGFAA